MISRLDGTPLSVVATTDLGGQAPGSTHFDALKFVAPSTLLLASNLWDSEEGHAYAWDWKAGQQGLVQLNTAVGSAHDIQAAYSATPAAAFDVPGVTDRRVRPRPPREEHRPPTSQNNK